MIKHQASTEFFQTHLRPCLIKTLRHQFNFITEFWKEKVDFEEWHKGKVVPIPKSGELSDPDKWRGVNLMGIVAKLFSSMLCKCLFKIIKQHGIKYQFESSVRVRC